jgi:hypothetical protein
MRPSIVRVSSLLLVALAASMFTSQAQAKTIYPNDGYIEHIKFLSDGVEVKLTAAGLRAGTNRGNAITLAKWVRAYHQNTYNFSSAINPTKLGNQIWEHCLAYALGERRHSNPVNVSWGEIT